MVNYIKTSLASLLTFFLSGLLLLGQTATISSESSYIKIHNNFVEIEKDDLTTPLPLTIVYPKFAKDRSIVSEVDQINLIGKLTDPLNTTQVFINNKETKISKEGLFFEVIDLSPGTNILNIKTNLKTGKTIVVKFYLEYNTGS